ncbi:Alpha beta hydrolase [Desmophyllum pertusum]|uniref:acylglycerol lipase n=1 Tax=Desmophyllum pertusum TaxID=174260 RepID=A0A9W9Z4N3_9CNID|nr:Alpha beta hydrolase [Desmophyllum pertusum]
MILKASFTIKYVSVGDFRFSYIERGKRQGAENVILMVHGFTGDKGVWCLMGNALPKTFHLVAVDLPGHGYTTRKHHDDHSIPAQAAKLHQFVMAIGLDKRKFHLVGLSMGGFVAGIFAARYSSLLSSLVLMCPAGIKAPKLSDFFCQIANGGKNYLLPENPEDFNLMLKKQHSRAFYEKVLTEISHPDQRFLLHDVLEDIDVPTLALWGDNDEILDVSAVDIIREKVKDCEIQILDSCGHAITLERPWRSAKLILQFINSLAQRG